MTKAEMKTLRLQNPQYKTNHAIDHKATVGCNDLLRAQLKRMAVLPNALHWYNAMAKDTENGIHLLL